MSKWLTFLSSLALITYGVFSLYLPTKVKEITNFPPDFSVLDEVESKIETTDPETLKDLTKMMVKAIRDEELRNNEVLDSAIDFYLAYDEILIWLLVIHFAFVFQNVFYSKPNNQIQPTPNSGSAD